METVNPFPLQTKLRKMSGGAAKSCPSYFFERKVMAEQKSFKERVKEEAIVNAKMFKEFFVD